MLTVLYVEGNCRKLLKVLFKKGAKPQEKNKTKTDEDMTEIDYFLIPSVSAVFSSHFSPSAPSVKQYLPAISNNELRKGARLTSR